MTRDDVIRWAREAGMKLSPAQFSGVLECEADEFQLAEFAAKVAAHADKWRQAIDHELVVAHLGVAAQDADPAALLSQLIQWHVDVALDPAVSESAQALLAAEREACAQMCDARSLGDNNREDAEARRCAAAIRARSTP